MTPICIGFLVDPTPQRARAAVVAKNNPVAGPRQAVEKTAEHPALISAQMRISLRKVGATAQTLTQPSVTVISSDLAGFPAMWISRCLSHPSPQAESLVISCEYM
jgi:hypothetical protein